MVILEFRASIDEKSFPEFPITFFIICPLRVAHKLIAPLHTFSDIIKQLDAAVHLMYVGL